MRRHKGLLVGVAAVALLLLLAALAGRLGMGTVDRDTRASTYAEGPSGVSALYEALTALHVRTTRRIVKLAAPLAAEGREALVLLAPVEPLLPNEEKALLAYIASPGGGDVIVAESDPLVGCFGYGLHTADGYSNGERLRRVNSKYFDSASVVFGQEVPRRPFFAHAVLHPDTAIHAAAPLPFRPAPAGCAAVAIARVDTLINSPPGPVALLVRPAASAHDVILVSDASLFRNRSARSTDAGVYLLSLLTTRYDHVVFDEYHQGYGGFESLGRALVEWSLRSPVGWGVWQAAIVGVIALVVAGVRFGKPRSLGERTRRSSREHVTALATALAASRGHDVAIDVLVRGLRRRLGSDWSGGHVPGNAASSVPALAREQGHGDASPAARRSQPAPSVQRAWLDDLARRPLPPRVNDAITRLQRLTIPGQDEAAVLAAANAVEDAWDALRLSGPTSWRRRPAPPGACWTSCAAWSSARMPRYARPCWRS